MKRHVALETIDGEECVRVPLGSKGKHGTCIMLRVSWEKYLSDNHSKSLRLINGNVFNGSNQSVAKIITEAAGLRIEFRNDNPRDLRLRNLELVAGKSGPRIAPAPKITRSVKRPEELCDSGGRADQPVIIDYGFHEIRLMPANDNERLDKWCKKMKRRGAKLRDLEIAKKEIFLMKEGERLSKPLYADNYNPQTGKAQGSGEVKRFGTE